MKLLVSIKIVTIQLIFEDAFSRSHSSFCPSFDNISMERAAEHDNEDNDDEDVDDYDVDDDNDDDRSRVERVRGA